MDPSKQVGEMNTDLIMNISTAESSNILICMNSQEPAEEIVDINQNTNITMAESSTALVCIDSQDPIEDNTNRSSIILILIDYSAEFDNKERY